MDTVRIKSSHPPSQGPFVVIDADTFDPSRHELWGEEAQSAPVTDVERISGEVVWHSPPGAPEAPERSMADLRAEYQRVIGKRPFPGWPASTLRDKIAEAKSV